MNKPALLVTGILALALGGVIVVQARGHAASRRELAAARAALAAQSAQTERDRAEMARLQARNELFKSESDSLRAALAGGKVVAPTGAPVDAAGTGPAEPAVPGEENPAGGMMKGLSKMFKDPEMRKMMRSQQGMGIRLMYADLTKELGLAPDEANHVMELLTDRQLGLASASMEVFNGQETDPKKTEEASKAVAASREEYDKQLKGVLGEERMKKLTEYERTLGDRMQMQQVQQSFAASGVPLDERQRQGLLDIMKDERLKTPPNPFEPSNKDVAAQVKALQSGEGLAEVVRTSEEFNQRVLGRARTVLSPDQMNAFEAAQKQQVEMMQMGFKMGREMMKGQTQGSGAPPPSPPAPVGR